MHAAVAHAVTSMRRRFDEPLTLHELAAEVFVSPFHFSRVFSSTVGVTPGRFLTAVRLFEAKRRLLHTDETVADIVCSVGYSSVGTFTSRFTRAVGLTPGQYRDPVVEESLLALSPAFSRVPDTDVLERAALEGLGSASVAVGVTGAEGAARAFVAVFGDGVPQGNPIALSVVDAGEAGVTLRGLPVGCWTMLAVAVADDGTLTTATGGIEVRRHETVLPPVELELRRPSQLDVPVAVSLLDPGHGQPGPSAGAVVGRRLRAVA